MKSKPLIRNRNFVVLDMGIIIASVFGAFALRFELGPLFFYYLPFAYWVIGVSLIVKPLVFYFFGMYRRMWVYASIKELRLVALAVTTSSIIVFVLLLVIYTIKPFVGFPRSVIIIDWLVSLLLVGGVRFLVRIVAESTSSIWTSSKGKQTKRALIIGAGDAGALVVRELLKNPDLNLKPVGFLDDNSDKLRQQIHGIPVVGTLTDIAKVLVHKRIDEVIIAIPSAGGKVIRLVTDVCRLQGISFRTMPGIYELIGGKVSINRLREVDITDLLRRQPSHMKEELVGATLTGKTVMVTGAGGSIGRELCRQISRWDPQRLILVGHGENSIFESMLEIQESNPALPMVPVIVDVREDQRLDKVFKKYRPDIVFHAAAHKHVPLMEMNIAEAVNNNVRGTRNVVAACQENNVQHLVMISTDKAIKPINIMGATKRFSEMIVLDAARLTGRAYSVVRFGNVLGSRGSVVPLFKHQIARGGPVTVTHPDMKRYFMTIPEAVYLVLQAAGMSSSGEMYVLNMGQQVRILDLAEDLIRLSGLEPGKDIEIAFTGVRLGEKLSEDLWEEGHQFSSTQHPDIYQYDDPNNLSGEKLKEKIDQLLSLSDQGDSEAIVKFVDQTIPGADLASTPPPELISID
ncbi:MAG: nucleoside-diphosphate sugar epimerase/dehydratase [Chloroflexi bacterium]|nr:nucleoside-diphosphate sugar epimerase/dehydratase [Chloroflexota bacterium]